MPGLSEYSMPITPMVDKNTFKEISVKEEILIIPEYINQEAVMKLSIPFARDTLDALYIIKDLIVKPFPTPKFKIYELDSVSGLSTYAKGGVAGTITNIQFDEGFLADLMQQSFIPPRTYSDLLSIDIRSLCGNLTDSIEPNNNIENTIKSDMKEMQDEWLDNTVQDLMLDLARSDNPKEALRRALELALRTLPGYAYAE